MRHELREGQILLLDYAIRGNPVHVWENSTGPRSKFAGYWAQYETQTLPDDRRVLLGNPHQGLSEVQKHGSKWIHIEGGRIQIVGERKLDQYLPGL